MFCDYDADGICGGSALYRHLRGMGADADIFSPNRHMEGYGLSTDAVRRIAAGGATLIVTVDCGITNVEEVALARELGVDVIVTDHHECGEALPDTPWIVNPKRERQQLSVPVPGRLRRGVQADLRVVLAGGSAALRRPRGNRHDYRYRAAFGREPGPFAYRHEESCGRSPRRALRRWRRRRESRFRISTRRA